MLIQIEQILIEGTHALGDRFGHHLLDLMNAALEDEICDQWRAEHDLEGGDSAGTAEMGYQALRYDGPQIEGQIHQHLFPLFLGKQVDDPIQRLIGTVSVQRTET